MSGIYGFAAQERSADPSAVLDRMLEAVPIAGPSTQHQWVAQAGNAGLGVVHPARIGDPGHFAYDSASRVSCVLDGVVYRNEDRDHASSVEPNGAVSLLKRYLDSGLECLDEVSGSFSVALWDGRDHRLVLANDKIGHRLLFFTLQANTLIFASVLARIMAAGLFSPEIDVEGLSDLLVYAHTLGGRTLFKDVHILPPGSVLTYKESGLQIRQYWSLEQIEVRGQYDRRRIEELEEIFKRVVRRSIRPDLTCAVALTGGIDSRCIVAAAANQRLPFIAHTGGQPDSTDVVLARRVAELAGVRHVFRTINPRKLGQQLFPMVLRQGGIIATLDSQTCGLFDNPPPFDVQIQGITGETARGTWLTPADLDISDPAAAKAALGLRILTKTARNLDLEKLWQPGYRSFGVDAPREHLNAVLSGYLFRDSPLLIYDYFGIYEHTRKLLNKATMIVRSVIEDYLPYLDHQWLEAIWAVPVSERVTRRIQVDLIRRLYPALLAVPHEKNLIPLSASPRRIWLVKRYRGVRRRLGRRFKFLKPPSARVPTVRTWEWSRHEMCSVLSELLYNPNAAFRAYLRWENVEPLLDQHFSGQEEWKNLVSTLTVFEIAHRLWVNP